MSKIFNALKIAANFGKKHVKAIAGMTLAGATVIGLALVGKNCGVEDSTPPIDDVNEESTENVETNETEMETEEEVSEENEEA